MPRQYIYTSARRGLEPGKSGFCCVARDRDLPQDLQRELERLSRYERENSEGRPRILRFLRIEVRSGKFAILSRIVDSGTDYSSRDNHLAHHLVVAEEEISDLPDPSSILLSWKGWRDKWEEPPRVLDERDQFNREDLELKEISRDADIELPPLVEDKTAVPQILNVERGGEHDVVLAIRSALLTLPAQERWKYAFTNFLLTTDRPSQFTWSANWINRDLPYDLSLKPVTADDLEELEGDEEASEDEGAAEPTAADRLKSLPAPVVEMPTFKRAKKPKRRWTQKRISRWINASIIILGILCIYLGYTWFTNYKNDLSVQKDDDPLGEGPKQASTGSVKQPALSAAELQQEWRELFSSSTILDNLETARELASHLAESGNTFPSEQLRLLLAARNQSINTPVLVPNWAITVSESGSIDLHPDVTKNLAPSLYTLAPKSLLDQLSQLKSDFPYRFADPLTEPNSFDATTIERRIRKIQRSARSETLALSPEQLDSIERYLKLSTEGLESDPLQQLSGIGQAIDQPSYIELDEFGYPSLLERLSYKQYLYEIFDNYMVTRYRAFKRTTDFSLALTEASSRDFDTAMEAAKSMRTAFKFASADDPQADAALQAIRERWDETFHREDLMKETLIGFSIERLETLRSEMLQLARQFTRRELAAVRDYKQLLEQSEQLIDQARKSTLDQEWVVIPYQSTQFSRTE